MVGVSHRRAVAHPAADQAPHRGRPQKQRLRSARGGIRVEGQELSIFIRVKRLAEGNVALECSALCGLKSYLAGIRELGVVRESAR